MRLRAPVCRLCEDQSGATIVEFALILPALALTLMAIFDLSYNFYAETMIEGAVQKAARNSTVEVYAGDYDALDANVERAVRRIVYSADIEFSRTAYTNFSDVGRAEEFTDVNGDGVCNAGEPFEDANGDGEWSDSRAKGETGGARDAVLYEVTASYGRAFPLNAFIGVDPEVQVVARTVLRNQPFSLSETASVKTCP